MGPAQEARDCHCGSCWPPGSVGYPQASQYTAWYFRVHDAAWHSNGEKDMSTVQSGAPSLVYAYTLRGCDRYSGYICIDIYIYKQGIISYVAAWVIQSPEGSGWIRLVAGFYNLIASVVNCPH